MVVVSFLLLYQRRLDSLLKAYVVHALVLTAAVAWQALAKDTTHLLVVAGIVLAFNGMAVPMLLFRMVRRHGIDRTVEPVFGVALSTILGAGLVALAIGVLRPKAGEVDAFAREDITLALSVVLLGLLMMVSRRNAIGQTIGLLSVVNGLVLCAAAARGMPLLIEISVALTILIAFILAGMFLCRVRERFDTVDATAIRGLGEGGERD
jgi:hydrogenase-4 component E